MTNLSVVIESEHKRIKGTMGFRDDQKKQRAKISAVLIEGALQLSAEEGYASLSLRSVARRAGIAPTSFYRHFRDMDELGLAITEQARDILRDCLKQAAKQMSYPSDKDKPALNVRRKSIECIVRPFVETFFDYVSINPNLFRLFFQERTGSSDMLRDAINDQVDNASQYLAEQLERLGLELDEGFEQAFQVAGAMMTLVISGALKLLTREEQSTDEVAEQVIGECRFLLLGASMS